MSLSLPNPTVPTNGQPLDATPILQNELAIAQAIQNFDASQIQAGTLTASAFNSNINPNTILNETISPFVQSGCSWSAVSSSPPVGTMTGGVVYINGFRISVNSVPSHTFTVSEDTYVDVDTNGNLTYSGVSNGANSPALAANNIRIAKIVTNTTSITSVVQSGSDTIGNPIYIAKAITPNQIAFNIAGSALISTGIQTGFSNSSATALSTTTFPPITLLVPAGYKVMFFGQTRLQEGTGTITDMNIYVYADNVTPQTTPNSIATFATNSGSATVAVAGMFTGLSTGSHTFSLWGSSTSGNAMSISNAFILFMVVPS